MKSDCRLRHHAPRHLGRLTDSTTSAPTDLGHDTVVLTRQVSDQKVQLLSAQNTSLSISI